MTWQAAPPNARSSKPRGMCVAHRKSNGTPSRSVTLIIGIIFTYDAILHQTDFDSEFVPNGSGALDVSGAIAKRLKTSASGRTTGWLRSGGLHTLGQSLKIFRCMPLDVEDNHV